MFWKKKKEELVLVKDEDKWVKEILLDFNLLDVNNLWGIMEVVNEKKEQQLLKEILNIMQPLLMDNIKKGFGYVELILEKDEHPVKRFESFEWQRFNSVSQKIAKYNLYLTYENINYYENNKPIQFKFTLGLSNPKKEKQ